MIEDKKEQRRVLAAIKRAQDLLRLGAHHSADCTLENLRVSVKQRVPRGFRGAATLKRTRSW